MCPPLLQTFFMIWTFFYRPAWCHLPEPSAPQGLSQTSLCSIKNIPECLRWARPCGGVWPSPTPPAQRNQDDDDDDVPWDKSSSEHAQEQSPTNFSIPTFCDCYREKNSIRRNSGVPCAASHGCHLQSCCSPASPGEAEQPPGAPPCWAQLPLSPRPCSPAQQGPVPC